MQENVEKKASIRGTSIGGKQHRADKYSDHVYGHESHYLANHRRGNQPSVEPDGIYFVGVDSLP